MYVEKRPGPARPQLRRPARTSAARSCSPSPNCVWPHPASSRHCSCRVSRAPTTYAGRCATCWRSPRPWSAGPTAPSRATGTAPRPVSPKQRPPVSSHPSPAGPRASASPRARPASGSTAWPWSTPSSPSTGRSSPITRTGGWKCPNRPPPVPPQRPGTLPKGRIRDTSQTLRTSSGSSTTSSSPRAAQCERRRPDSE